MMNCGFAREGSHYGHERRLPDWSADGAAKPDSKKFMGRGPDRARFLGRGIGLTTNGWPVPASDIDEPLEENMTLTLGPLISLPRAGLAEMKHAFATTPEGARSLAGGHTAMRRVEG